MQQRGCLYISLQNSSSEENGGGGGGHKEGSKTEIAKSEVIHHFIHRHVLRKHSKLYEPQNQTQRGLPLCISQRSTTTNVFIYT